MSDFDPSQEPDAGEIAELVGNLLNGNLGDPQRYLELHNIEVVALDIGEITFSHEGVVWRLLVSRDD